MPQKKKKKNIIKKMLLVSMCCWNPIPVSPNSILPAPRTSTAHDVMSIVITPFNQGHNLRGWGTLLCDVKPETHNMYTNINMHTCLSFSSTRKNLFLYNRCC